MSCSANYRQVRGSPRPRPFFRARLSAGRQLTPHIDVLVDTGSVVTVFSTEILPVLGLDENEVSWTHANGNSKVLVWRGMDYRRGKAPIDISLEGDSGEQLSWEALISFSDAPIQYALLGDRGGLEFLDATFRTRNQIVELTANAAFPGVVIPRPD